MEHELIAPQAPDGARGANLCMARCQHKQNNSNPSPPVGNCPSFVDDFHGVRRVTGQPTYPWT